MKTLRTVTVPNTVGVDPLELKLVQLKDELVVQLKVPRLCVVKAEDFIPVVLALTDEKSRAEVQAPRGIESEVFP